MKRIILLSAFFLIPFSSESFAMNLETNEHPASDTQNHSHRPPLQDEFFDVDPFASDDVAMICFDGDCEYKQHVNQQPLEDEPGHQMSCNGFVPFQRSPYRQLYFPPSSGESYEILPVDEVTDLHQPLPTPHTPSQTETSRESVPVGVAPVSLGTKGMALRDITNAAFKKLCEMGPTHTIPWTDDLNKENRRPITSGPTFYLWDTSIRPVEVVPPPPSWFSQ